MNPAIKNILHWAGSILAICGIVFVILRIYEHSEQLELLGFNTVAWVLVFCLVLLYGFGNSLLAFAWWSLLRYFSIKTTLMWALKTYGISQLAKYMPGNIFHLVGRQAIGMEAGIPSWPLLKSTFWELLLISIIAAFFGILLIPLFLPSLSLWIPFFIFIVFMGIFIVFVWMRVGLYIVQATGWYIAYLILSGFVFVSLFSLIVPLDDSVVPLASLCSAYVIAWLAGLVTPGAPAGMGVREVVLLLLLGENFVEVDILLAVVLGRIVTMAGDVLFYLISILFPKREAIITESDGVNI